MSITLAFDVYGILIDTRGVAVELEKHVGSKAAWFSKGVAREAARVFVPPRPDAML